MSGGDGAVSLGLALGSGPIPPPAPQLLESKALSACRLPAAQVLCLGASPGSCEWASGSCTCLSVSDVEVLKVERIQLIDAVLNLCTYHHPENIQLPPG